MLGKKNTVFIAGPEIPCARCIKTTDIVTKIISDMNLADSTEIRHIVLFSKPTIEKYGRLRSPAVIFNDVIISEGEIPQDQHIIDSIKEVLSQS